MFVTEIVVARHHDLCFIWVSISLFYEFQYRCGYFFCRSTFMDSICVYISNSKADRPTDRQTNDVHLYIFNYVFILLPSACHRCVIRCFLECKCRWECEWPEQWTSEFEYLYENSTIWIATQFQSSSFLFSFILFWFALPDSGWS